ncbi:hypothetical protein QBC38DRAFT_480113 [Podospora fimiseda]|uniref:T6SS Phospholipase effector Tle1-like catalytic domain-containing protein n=1 Tax=Podospora fimiseda TaxID=252190 RepID=A0AAN7BNH1_9PEZI|nr:hypothetical protein QBC38DRAFT_480113 [Podospora fimiseda]
MSSFNPFIGSGDQGGFRQGGFVDTSIKANPKRMIICCDGTWQSSVTNAVNIPSNVTRLARYITNTARDQDGKFWEQVVYYDAGIGTGVSKLEADRQGGTGSGFVGNVIEAYNFIVLNYNPGDQIFCIGFSRGAYTARAVAGLVTDIGIIQPRDMQDFPELYSLYQAHTDSHMFRKSKTWREWVEGVRRFDPDQKNLPQEWKRSPSQWLKRPHGAPPESTRWVEAVGVFDTVGSLGIPEMEGWFTNAVVKLFGKAVPVEKFGFHNVALSPYIKNAYHALALDEHRKPFDATLWHFPADGVSSPPKPAASATELREKWNNLRDTDGATEAQLAKAWEELVGAEMYEELKGSDSKLLQVWFPGVHINIGGGSDDLLPPDSKKEEDRNNPETWYHSDLEQIAMITLTWMIEQFEPHLGFEIGTAPSLMEDRYALVTPVLDELLSCKTHAGNRLLGWLKPETHASNWLVKKVKSMKGRDDTPPDVWNDNGVTWSRNIAADALMGWASGPIIDSYVGNMTKAGSQYRTPGEYRANKGRTNEYIHPTVAYRMDRLADEEDKYEPIALKDFKRKKVTTEEKQADGSVKEVVSYEWVKAKGNVRIPEYKIHGPFDEGRRGNIERACIVSPSACSWIGKLDKEYGIDSWQAQDLNAKPTVSEPQTNRGYVDPNNGLGNGFGDGERKEVPL